MPTAKEYRRLSREDDKHRVLFRGMAKWKAAQERGEDLPVGDFTAVTLEDVVPGRREPSPQDIADVQAMIAADIGIPVRMLDPIPNTPEAREYLTHLFGKLNADD